MPTNILGAGETTTLHIIYGLIKLDYSEVRVRNIEHTLELEKEFKVFRQRALIDCSISLNSHCLRVFSSVI
ncbi:MAG: hypothetical protein DRJ63_08655 [Thermoprotei archaeon]|nr:MAG: hypothetical protein DRJ63_08655 [Thermoprotei archaeon]